MYTESLDFMPSAGERRGCFISHMFLSIGALEEKLVQRRAWGVPWNMRFRGGTSSLNNKTDQLFVNEDANKNIPKMCLNP